MEEEIKALSKVLLEVRQELRRVQGIEDMVPEDHVLLTIPVGKLAGIILGVVGIKRFPKPESFVTAVWTLWWSDKATISKGIKRGDT